MLHAQNNLTVRAARYASESERTIRASLVCAAVNALRAPYCLD